MVIDEKHHHTLANRAYSLSQVGELFGLTPEELDHPSCGSWMVDNIKQLLTANLLLKSTQMRRNENQKVENYQPDPFANKPNPLTLPNNQTNNQ